MAFVHYPLFLSFSELIFPEVLLINLLFLVSIVSMLLTLCDKSVEQSSEPPTVPYMVPFIRSALMFAFGGPNFWNWISAHFKDSPAIHLGVFQDDIYVVHGPKNVLELFRNHRLTMTKAYGITLKHCFGMKQASVDVYMADTSGSRQKPIVGSNVPAAARIGLATHENLATMFQGKILDQMTARLEDAFYQSLKTIRLEDDWTYLPDLTHFFETYLGGAILEALFGKSLIQQKDFVKNLFDYDHHVMDLARRYPYILAPKAYHTRSKVLASIKTWHQQAQDSDSLETEDCDSSKSVPWGSDAMKERYETLSQIEGQDKDALASADLALIWASVTNVVPSSAALLIHTLRDRDLLEHTRERLERIPPGTHRFDLKVLEKEPLLQSMYAETLRFGVQIHIPRCAPHHSVQLGNLFIPKGKLILINTAMAQNEEPVWNMEGTKYPPQTFWAKRFLNRGLNDRAQNNLANQNVKEADHPETFSIEGLEGSWIPFGGGHHACPGRLVAKRIMLLTLAVLVSTFDIELLTDNEFGSERFGFGVRKPKRPVAFRMRRRCCDEQGGSTA